MLEKKEFQIFKYFTWFITATQNSWEKYSSFNPQWANRIDTGLINHDWDRILAGKLRGNNIRVINELDQSVIIIELYE